MSKDYGAKSNSKTTTGSERDLGPPTKTKPLKKPWQPKGRKKRNEKCNPPLGQKHS